MSRFGRSTKREAALRRRGNRRVNRRTRARLGRARRDGAARARGRRDGVEQLPGEALERRAGEDRGASTRRARRDRPRPRQRPDAGRHRDVHPVGRRVRAPGDRARRLLPCALPRRVPAGVQRVGRDEAADEPERAADALRDAAVPARRRQEASGSTGRRRSSPPRCGATSSARSNYVLGVVLFAVALFFAGMSTKLDGAAPPRGDARDRALVFVGTVIWIATFPISVGV